MARRAVRLGKTKAAKGYDHKEAEAVLRPDIGIQAQFKKKKEPAKYRYDRSLDPQLSWEDTKLALSGRLSGFTAYSDETETRG
jgi:adenine-specific DNA-methyltransferase